MTKSRFKLVFKGFARIDFINKSFLVGSGLPLHGFKMTLEVNEELVNLFFFTVGSLKCLLHGKESSLKFVFVLN